MQSVGAGGGAILSNGANTVYNFGGANGNGGRVDVSVDGAISPSGAAAHGVVAQSIGGGGGLIGAAVDNAMSSFAGSLGGTGDAGPITILIGGSVKTTGAGANGVIVQSAGGVDATSIGDAIGIFGSVSATRRGADGVVIRTNATSSFHPEILVVGPGGSITGSKDGAAVRIFTPGDADVRNDGTITGSIQLAGEGRNVFTNGSEGGPPTATLVAGSMIDLRGGRFNNAGTLSSAAPACRTPSCTGT